jgi:tetratricopeptide (TPR) repeat protein
MRSAGVVLTLAAAMAWGEPVAPLPPVNEVAEQLRRIESAQYRGAVDALRIDFQNQAAARPADPLPRIYIAWCSMISDGAWNQLKAISMQYPDIPWVHLGMGRIYTVWKMKELAAAEFDGALQRHPDFYPALTARGDLLRRQGELAGAQKAYQAALALADDPQAHAGLGLALLAAQHESEARQELAAAIHGWPDQPPALEALSRLAVAARAPEALDATLRLAELKPRDRTVRRLVADLRYDAGDHRGATAEYEKLVKLGNPDPVVIHRLVELYREAGEGDAEEKFLAVEAAMDPKATAPGLRIAELRELKHDEAGAAREYAEVLARDPSMALPHVKLAQAKEAHGVLWQALLEYRIAGKLEGPEAEAARARADELEKSFNIPKVPFVGGVQAMNVKISITLNRFYEERLKQNPKLAGTIKVRVRVGDEGAVDGVDVLEDTVGDPQLTGHAVFALWQAQWEPKRRQPEFEIELKPKKGK